MKIKIPFNYNTLLAFLKLLKYENKRSITIETLHKFHEGLLNEVYEDYIYNDHSYYNEVDKWKGNIEFVINDNDSIENFLNTYSDLFYIDNDTIYLYDNISYEELESEIYRLQKEENISNRFFNALDSSEKIYKILNINSIKNILLEYLKIEKKLEYNYNQIILNDTVKNNIKKLLVLRALFLMNLSQKKDYQIDAFRTEAERIDDPNYDYIKKPINMKLWTESEYFLEQSNSMEDIDDLLYDINQYAIFGNTSLSLEKLENLLTTLTFFDDDNEEDIDYDDTYNEDDIDYEDLDSEDYIDLTNPNESDLIFYLTYIDKLNEYMKEYGITRSLIETKNRLLYALDTHELCLFEEENLVSEINKIKEMDIDVDSFHYLKNEMRFLANEIFTTNDNNTIKKLLLLSTYYELTKDIEIENIINKYCMNNNFKLFSNIIFGNKGYSKKLSNI